MPDKPTVAATGRPPIRIGTVVHPWGTIEMIGWIFGERYYWIIGKHGCVSMMPAQVVEDRHGKKQD